MTLAKPKYIPEPRILNKYQTATRLGLSTAGFDSKRKAWEKIGFPAENALLGGWDAKAIEHWLDLQSGLNRDEAPANDHNWADI